MSKEIDRARKALQRQLAKLEARVHPNTDEQAIMADIRCQLRKLDALDPANKKPRLFVVVRMNEGEYCWQKLFRAYSLDGLARQLCPEGWDEFDEQDNPTKHHDYDWAKFKQHCREEDCEEFHISEVIGEGDAMKLKDIDN